MSSNCLLAGRYGAVGPKPWALQCTLNPDSACAAVAAARWHQQILLLESCSNASRSVASHCAASRSFYFTLRTAPRARHGDSFVQVYHHSVVRVPHRSSYSLALSLPRSIMNTRRFKFGIPDTDRPPTPSPTIPEHYTDSELRFHENSTPCEWGESYRPSGLHPVQIGDVLNDRYEILCKLGYGSFSTVWLAADSR